ncbi:hypothetical protein PPL_03887 [Heterostelium album PN500]|uniref:Uncharacterized protein n=1 Tax=Heterostelium pallidum (strain ATCC 26659 / Pp 5 / PN500) TaxID=670386 RepID=D3B5E9_HETP5|nr:hypothetical protein PPL_03887 [Heterostelium album PN500]EFA83097.1 hypothetical protein PPL_03887 [Heterostelium album PN500]|eukprot:XP_020435214.1 hypothetical protein PPL_03887 [Heterostelium album PN500]
MNRVIDHIKCALICIINLIKYRYFRPKVVENVITIARSSPNNNNNNMRCQTSTRNTYSDHNSE